MKLVSWNVNSLRSAETKFLDFINKKSPDLVMLQELRAEPNQLSMFLQNIPQYKILFNPSGRPGYGGTALYYKENIPVDDLTNITSNPLLNSEGRTIQFKLDKTIFLNFYVPNGNRNQERLNYKLDFFRMIINYVKSLLAQKYSVVIGADMNVAHTEIDLYSPRANIRNSGFLPYERQLFNQLIETGFVDTFRYFNKMGSNYTWWSLRDPKRILNHGWRYDYFLVSKDSISQVKKSEILKNVFGSDHCPILLEMET